MTNCSKYPPTEYSTHRNFQIYTLTCETSVAKLPLATRNFNDSNRTQGVQISTGVQFKIRFKIIASSVHRLELQFYQSYQSLRFWQRLKLTFSHYPAFSVRELLHMV